MTNQITNTTGQSFLKTKELLVNRPDPTSTTGAREVLDLSPLLSSINVLTLDIDATAGTVDTAFTLPAGALVMFATLDVTTTFADGTSLEVGLAGDNDSLFIVTTPSTGAVASAGVGIGAIAAGDYDVTVTGSYSAGAAHLKVVWMDTRKTTDDPETATSSSQITLGLQDSLGDSSEAGTAS